MKSVAETRDKIYDAMRLELHGPNARDDFKRRNEELIQTPQTVYSCGILFPRETKIEELESADNEDNTDIVQEDEDSELEVTNQQNDRNSGIEQSNSFDDLNLSSQLKPSAISISFRVKDVKEIFVKINYAQYKKISMKDHIAKKVKADYVGFDDLIEWFKTTNLAEKTIRNYLSALVFLSKDFKEQSLTEEILIDITNNQKLETIRDKYFQIEANRNFNREKHNRFSAALEQYILYRKETSLSEPHAITDNNVTQDEVVITDHNKPTATLHKRFQKWYFFKLNLEDQGQFKGYENIIENENDGVGLKAFYNIRRVYLGLRTITISLINNHTKTSNSNSPTEHLFFQPEIIVKKPIYGSFYPIAQQSKFNIDLDSKIEELQYRSIKTYARGHSCSGDWIQKDNLLDNDVGRVFSNLFPKYEVNGTAQRKEPYNSENNLSTSFNEFSNINLSLNENKANIIKVLRSFLKDYKDWNKKLVNDALNLNEKYNEASKKIISDCDNAYLRIEKGINFLENNNKALSAFIIANRAILFQQCHFNLQNRSVKDKFFNPSNDIENSEYTSRGWRPFQLAFILMNIYTLPSDKNISPENSKDVELIWFPTGGGKTEAYLGLAAFSIAYNRLIGSRFSYGVEVIMRYTLRLLTSQQFQRASTMICALEYIRSSENLNIIEASQFSNSIELSIGLWVGGSLTPNTNKDALIKKKELVSTGSNPFQILSCPWCKTSLENPLGEENPTYDGYQTKSVKGQKEVVLQCHEGHCFYYGKFLPIYVVDEQLYTKLPTILIGTVDKFAQLSWRQEPRKFFGLENQIKPPSLIIQDELHLISGPLGSIVGHYEYLVRAMCKSAGFLPKIVASTATIKAASSQVKKLYLSKVNIFPPNGLDYGDNYFSFPDKEGKGRLYVGVFASATPSVITAQRNLVSPLLLFPSSLFYNEDENFETLRPGNDESKEIKILKKEIYKENVDPYGTILWYFNTLRELGYASSLIYSDISPYLPNIMKRKEIPWAFKKKFFNTKELTSRVSESDIAVIEKQLNIKWRPSPDYKAIHKNDVPIDILLATNMISVGVDIPRLGLMVITGQPKNTAEYIQASSRVGRGSEGSGLVFTLYNQSRSRDRSHFENFKNFHQSLYRHVEPSSVTPLSPKSRERCLAALVVGIARHLCGLENVINFSEGTKTKIQDFLQEYFEQINEEDRNQVNVEIQKIYEIWDTHIQHFGQDSEWGGMQTRAKDEALLAQYNNAQNDDQLEKIGLLLSMRNVDTSSEASIINLATLGD
ncbi:helicase-related protein [Pseudomonadota bacterium]|nr:helicase-related protein [Pseudomonadota bacterium]